MLVQILLGSVLLLVTTITHALGMSLGLSWLTIMHGKQSDMGSLKRSLVIGALVVIMFITTITEAAIWAGVYFALGAESDLITALYFSIVTYTTLGYGDIVLESGWRLLSSFQAINGVIMFGWTTAVIIVGIHHFSRSIRNLEIIDK